MARQELDAAVHGLHPPVLVIGEGFGVVQVHLDQILVVAVSASRPASLGVQERAVADRYVSAEKSRERLAKLRVNRVDQIRLCLLRELAIRGVACQVGQTLPLQDERAGGCKTVGGRVTSPGRVEEDAVVRDAGRCVKGELEVISQVLGLFQKGLNLARVVHEG